MQKNKLKEQQEKAIVERIRRENLKGGKKKPKHHSKRVYCDVPTFPRCTGRVEKEVRIWAGHELHFCSEHLKEWDDVILKALSGEWGDKDAVQVKSTTKKVSRRPQVAKARAALG